MSVYFVKAKGSWRYHFMLKGERHTEAGFKTKKEATKAEAKRREELERVIPQSLEEIHADITFLDLVNMKLDHVKAYNSQTHYEDYIYMARRWVKLWGSLKCNQISQFMIERQVLERRKVSAATANREIRYLRAVFNFGKKKRLIKENPLDGMEFFPEEKRIKYVPSFEDIDKVISVADSKTRDYLVVMRETMGRMNEINQLTWDDVDFDENCVILYTRKKKGGHRTPRKIPMTKNLFDLLSRLSEDRDASMPWVFWHSYRSSKTGEYKRGPYRDRKKFMKTLCRKAGVKYFRFHAIRHAGASLMDSLNVPIGAIQKILGHEHRTTTEIYLHGVRGDVVAAMAEFESAEERIAHQLAHRDARQDTCAV